MYKGAPSQLPKCLTKSMKLALCFALAMAMVLMACGGGSTTSSSVAGSWAATLTNSSGTTVYAINTSLTQTSGTAISGTSITFTTGGAPCFEELGTQSGQFVISGGTNSFALTITGAQPGAPSLNSLTLNGTLSGNKITGTWMLVGTGGCSGSGNFTMTKS
jgi:hypothetical protein